MTAIASRWISSGTDHSGSLLDRVMAARQYPTDQRSRELLNAPRANLLHLPRELPGATAVAERLERAVRGGQKIAIYGDYDADGMTATAILWRVIRAARADANLRYYVPARIEEGYGLNDSALQELADDGVKTVVTVDCGASALEQSKLARRLGLELLITDHHHVDLGQVADCDAIAHPSLPGREPAAFCDLCGAAVAFKVACEFARLWCGGEKVAGVLQDALSHCLSLVAIGTVADLMPLRDENRVFVARGVSIMQSVDIVGLRALLDDAKLVKGQRVDSSHIGFRLGPRLNAVGRLGHAHEAVELLVTDDVKRAREIVQTLARLNTDRKRLDKDVFTQACERIDSDPVLAARGAIILADARWHEGVVGIAATRMTERYGKPSILLSLREDGTAKGSGRSVPGLDILEAVKSAAGDLMLRGGGHAYALGITLDAERVEEFAERVSAKCEVLLSGLPVGPVRHYDAEAAPQELTVVAVKALEILRPYGRGNEDPSFLLRGVRPTAPPTLFGNEKNHVEFFVAGGPRAVWFSAAANAHLIRQGVAIDMIVRPSIDTFRRGEQVQLIVQDLRLAD